MAQKSKILVFFLLFSSSVFAREGMWIPMLLDKNIDEMQKMGFKLSTDDVYSVNHSSLKDGIVLFGQGCSGELISPDGLLVTNHHCGYGQIQSHSSLEHDYLTDGFWAMNHEAELPNDGLSVTFLIEIRDVTNQVLAGTDTINIENSVQAKIKENTTIIEKSAINGTHYEASVKPFFNGNQYFLFITEKFTDIRLVGAPPSAIGKFGGDTDNWMWPRHTGDFSLFRIYADTANHPASYSPKNVPYHPKKFFPIDISEKNDGDFTMVLGYPGSTTSYLHSAAVKQIIEQRNPDRISIRSQKLAILADAMNADKSVRIKYASKYATTSNSWKKWQGETMGLKRLNAVDTKIKEEEEFARWVNADSARKKYETVLSEFEKLYAEISTFQKAKDYLDECVLRGADAYRIYSIIKTVPPNMTDSVVQTKLKQLEIFYKEYDFEVDQNIFVQLMKKYYTESPKELLPNDFKKLFYNKDPEDELAKIYQRSILCNPKTIVALLEKNNRKKLQKTTEKDKLCSIYATLVLYYNSKISPEFNRINQLIDKNQKIYMAALLEKNNKVMLFPDANMTMRVSYGKIEGLSPSDGVRYNSFTTLDGVMEKDNVDVYDYKVPEKLKALYAKKDYGLYANSAGKMPVCFAASNHTSGGNSGSPVIDANGNLIGINFDRAWEGTMSDILFDPEKCRNISLDMRYMLFLIDKFAGAGYLINEMKIVE